MSNKHVVCVLMRDPGCAEKLAAVLEAGEKGIVESRVAQSTDDFHRVLNHERVDLVVIENELEGFLSGLEILERLYGDLLRPQTVLLGSPSREAQKLADRVGVDRILKTSEPPERIREEVETLLTDSGDTQVLIPPAARSIVQNSPDLRPLPQLMTKLCAYLDHQTASITGLAEDISVDPKMTAELLKLINSTAFGFRTKVTTVFDAVKLLGIRRTVALVMAANMVRSQSDLSRKLPDDVRKWYNSRSVLMGSTASTFAKNLGNVSADTAYVLGLLQDVGVLLLAQFHSTGYLKLLERVRQVAALRLEVCEQQDFEVTHAQVSAALLQKWKLPPSLIALVLAHHDPDADSTRSDTERRFLGMMRIGEAVANLAENPAPQRHQSFQQLLAPYGGATGDVCRSLSEAIAKAVESSELFSLPAPDGEIMNRLLREAAAGSAADDAAETPTLNKAGAEATAQRQSAAQRAETTGARPAAGTRPASAHRQAAATTAPRPSAPKEGDRERNSPAEVGSRLLVVVDDPPILRSIEQMLADFDVEVLAARDGNEAHSRIDGIAALLCDVRLGEEHGAQLVRTLRGEGFRAPIIMVSGDRSRPTVVECLKAGANDFLIKPVEKPLLLDKLRKHGLPLRQKTPQPA